MSVSVVTLKTGDRIITELKEVFDGEGEDKKGVCLLMEDPYILSLDGATPQYLTEQHGMEYQVRLVSGIHIPQISCSRFRMIV